MTTQMIVRMDEELKGRLARLARMEGKAASEVVRELIEERVRERDIGAHIDGLWERIGGKLKAKGVTPSSIESAVKAARGKRG